MPQLEIRQLAVHYGAICALQDVNLSVDAGEIVTLLGANGAGKTTTLRAISGLLRPSAGDILFEGESITAMAPHDIVKLGIAHVPEGRGIFPAFTVAENLKLGAYMRRDPSGVRRDRDHALDLFPILRERLSQSAGTLSGGEQQMLAIARALLARPRVLLLDEPSLGLAPQIVKVIFQIIRKINAEGATILLVEQNARMALDVASHGYVLEVGRIAASNTAAELAKSDEIRKAYLGG